MPILQHIRASPPKIIGESRAIAEVRSLIKAFANSNDPVLILGESGTGKELVAKALHCQNATRKDLLATYNMAAANKDLFANELFGHEKGAYTGATEIRHGLAEQADGGTLFLDEIGDPPPEVQAQLLRFLDSGEIGKLSEKPGTNSHVNVRIIVATNTNLDLAVANKKFRDDVFYRLSGLRICLPSLQERKEDIPLLARHFLEELETKKFLSDAATNFLMAHSWPGNVRQLRLSIRSAHCLAGSKQEIRPGDFKVNAVTNVNFSSLTNSVTFPTFKEYLSETERNYFQKLTERYPNHNPQQLSLIAGLGRTTIMYRLDHFGFRIMSRNSKSRSG